MDLAHERHAVEVGEERDEYVQEDMNFQDTMNNPRNLSDCILEERFFFSYTSLDPVFSEPLVQASATKAPAVPSPCRPSSGVRRGAAPCARAPATSHSLLSLVQVQAQKRQTPKGPGPGRSRSPETVLLTPERAAGISSGDAEREDQNGRNALCAEDGVESALDIGVKLVNCVVEHSGGDIDHPKAIVDR